MITYLIYYILHAYILLYTYDIIIIKIISLIINIFVYMYVIIIYQVIIII